MCGVERFIEGPYKKYNNNYDWVSPDDRNTPQAFSHFTYESSNRTLLVCDIQGVGDLYTDPQIHSIDKNFTLGKGNLGQKGRRIPCPHGVHVHTCLHALLQQQ